NTRYVRLTGIQRGTRYGISVFEFGAFESASTATSVEEIKMVPDNFSLEQNYPNPFNPATQIGYNLDKSADVQLIVYDLLGREIVKLVDKRENAGRHTVTFNAKNLSSGIYYARLIAEGKTQIRKMVLLR
ncbi:MAG: T9SS type A sorting domain-containing protein, partial [Bacteroidetes bacterium]|nr:T9SS type A sorting domain-containing protein [Bacteroidota bacterium]